MLRSSNGFSLPEPVDEDNHRNLVRHYNPTPKVSGGEVHKYRCITGSTNLGTKKVSNEGQCYTQCKEHSKCRSASYFSNEQVCKLSTAGYEGTKNHAGCNFWLRDKPGATKPTTPQLPTSKSGQVTVPKGAKIKSIWIGLVERYGNDMLSWVTGEDAVYKEPLEASYKRTKNDVVNDCFALSPKGEWQRQR